jgi:MFS family permease
MRGHGAGRNAAFAALLLGMLMASLDTNVVVAALPSIGASLGHRGEVAGVTAAYLLAVAVATPLHGSLGDRWGRRPLFLGSVVVFGAGSAACAASPSMVALIGFRAVQGLGGSGLIVAAVAAMAELFSREELVRRQGWMTGVFAVSSVAGAPVGGFLAGSLGWRWIFLVNLPFCVAALVLGAGSVPARPAGRDRKGRFDLAGMALVAAAGTGIVILGSSTTLATSPVWAPLLAVISAGAVAGFVRAERRAESPLVPPQVLADPGLRRSAVVTLCSGVALFGSFTFVPLALTEGAGTHPATTGLLLLPMSIGQLVFTSGFAVLARRWPSIAAWGRLGLALGVAGMAAMVVVPALTPGTGRTVLAAAGLGLAGAALGLSMQAYTLIAQARAPVGIMGAAMATLSFARQIGGSAGIALFGWIVLLVTGPAGLTVVFALAALALAVALLAAPDSSHDSAPARRAAFVGGQPGQG